ncbi:MAG: hypothetical protein HXY40_08480 [Chloroflexi bacterium]|nr:hypothetical protein [Chloroflexota bacterium]
MRIILAHGALGLWDELLFFGIALGFTLFVLSTWWRSRKSFAPELEDDEPTPPLDDVNP